MFRIMKSYLLIISITLAIVLLALPIAAKAQQRSFRHSKHYKQRMLEFRSEGKLPQGSIILLGDSHMEFGGDWNRFFDVKDTIINRGIVGDDAVGMLHRLPAIAASKPKKVFLSCGTNDLSHGWSVTKVCAGVVRVLDYLQRQSPQTRLYVMSILPLCPEKGEWRLLKGKEKQILRLNKMLRNYATAHGITFIDAYKTLASGDGRHMHPDLCRDGLHLSDEGYEVLSNQLRRYMEAE